MTEQQAAQSYKAPRSYVQDMVKKMFGAETYLRVSSLSVGTAVQQILQNDPNRVGWMLTNRASNTGVIAFDEEGAAAGNGFTLGGEGGNFETNIRDDGLTPTAPVWGFAGAATSSWYLVEVILQSTQD